MLHSYTQQQKYGSMIRRRKNKVDKPYLIPNVSVVTQKTGHATRRDRNPKMLDREHS